MPELGKATYYLMVNSAEFNAGMAAAEEKALATNASIAKSSEAGMGRSAKSTKGLVGALGALAFVGYEGFKQMKEQSLSSGLLDNALMKAGKTAHTTRKQMDDLTNSIFNHSHETKADIMNAEQMALRFRSVADKARVVSDAIDIAAGTGKGLNTVMLAMGRGLADPIAGMGAFGRIGIKLTAAEKEMIKQVVASKGPLAGQAELLRLLELRYKGTAEAAAKNEPWRVLARDLQQIAATMTAHLIPAFKFLVTQMTAHRTATKLLVYALVALTGAIVLVKLGAFVKGIFEAARASKLWAAGTWLVNAAMKALAAAEEAVGLAIAFAKGEAVLFSEVMAATPWGAVALVIGIIIVVILKLTHHLPSLATMWKYVQKTLVSGMLFVVQVVKGAAYMMLQSFTLVIRGVLKLASHLPIIGGKAKAALNGINDFIGKFKPDWGGVADAWKGAGESSGKAFTKGAAKGMDDGKGDVKNAAVQTAQDVAAAAQQAMTDAADKLQPKVDEAVSKWTDRMEKKIQGARGHFRDAWKDLASTAFEAFDAATDKALSKYDGQLQKFQDKVSDAIDAVNAKIDASLAKVNDQIDAYGNSKTPGEQALADAQESRDSASRQQALTDAQRQLAEAKTAADVASAKKAIADANYEIWKAGEEKIAAAEREARNKQVQAMKDNAAQQAQTLKDNYAKQAAAAQAAYAKRIAKAKLDYSSERAVYRSHLEKWLNEEMNFLMKHPQQWAKVFGKITKVFGRDIAAGAQSLGRGFITKWSESVEEAAGRASKMTKVMTSLMRKTGHALANGIIGGMGETMPIGLYEVMVASTEKAIAAFKKKYHINSPSLVFAREVGLPLGQGVVQGFQQGAADLSRQTLTAPGASYSNGSASTYRAGGSATAPVVGAGGGSKKVEVHQHITRVDPDPFQLAHEAQYAAEGVWG